MKNNIKVIFKILIIILALVIIIAMINNFNPKQIVCSYGNSKLIVMYKNNEIRGYAANNLKFDIDNQKQVVKELGIDEYFVKLNEWFEENVGGSCQKVN